MTQFPRPRSRDFILISSLCLIAFTFGCGDDDSTPTQNNFLPHWEPVGNPGLTTVHDFTLYGGRLAAGGGFNNDENTNNVVLWDGTDWDILSAWSSGGIMSLLEYNGGLLASGVIPDGTFDSPSAIIFWDGLSWGPMGSLIDTWSRDLTLYDGFPVTSACNCHEKGLHDNTRFGYRWNGSSWEIIGTGTNGEIFALTTFEGDLIAGGGFTEAGGDSIDSIARWDGSAWQPIGEGFDGRVYTFTIYNNELIAGGDFTASGNTSVQNIARWNGDAWVPIGDGVNGSVQALTVYNGDLVAGGDFSQAGAAAALHIARWDGSAWSAVGPGFNGPVNALIVFEGELIAGGSFSRSSVTALNEIARFLE